jgi:coenzyme Q-binding protein COQ10
MLHHHETRILPYRPEQLFDLVVTIEDYPSFLPWCKAARVIQRDEKAVIADLVIGYKLFTEKFRSEVLLDRPHSIVVRYLSGPLSHLSNRWDFESKGKKGCALSFQVEFDFRNPLLRSAMQIFFDKALTKMVGAFENRAEQLYGQNKEVGHI